MPLSANPCEQAVFAIHIRLLHQIGRALATPNKSPQRTFILTVFGSARTNGILPAFRGLATRLSFLLRVSVDQTNGTSLRRNPLLRRELRLLLGGYLYKHAEM